MLSITPIILAIQSNAEGCSNNLAKSLRKQLQDSKAVVPCQTFLLHSVIWSLSCLFFSQKISVSGQKQTQKPLFV